MIVFAGPSIVGLPPELTSGLDLRPPARQGDVYLASLEAPEGIAIIDGYFDGVPAVWHKEILWTLAHDIPVCGASSMGALRAAELDVYGMVGIGQIYESYRDGFVEDDDEVALIHAPAAVGYTPLSIAMVNIRATCQAGIDRGKMTEGEVEAIIRTAKSLHYADRSWGNIVASADAASAHDRDPADLLEKLRKNFVDQKRLDAEALLTKLKAGEIPRPSSISGRESFDFEHTLLWHRMVGIWTSALQSPQVRGSDGFRLLGDDHHLR